MKIRDILVALNHEHSVKSLSKEVEIPERKFRETLNTLGCSYDNSARLWSFEGDENILDTEIYKYVQKKATKEKQAKSSTPVITEVQDNTPKEQDSTPKIADFSEDEILVLKQIIQEHKDRERIMEELKDTLYLKYHGYEIYRELSKVPIDVETVRSAFNMSKETTERLKKYASKSRLPLQDLVELAVLNLLDKYDGTKSKSADIDTTIFIGKPTM